jgi:hypothetical protein
MLDLVILPVRGWRGRVPTWLGIPCRIGRVTVWLLVQEDLGRHREFSLLVLLPQGEPEDAPPFIHLGMQFLLEYRARVLLDCSSTVAGQLIIPE